MNTATLTAICRLLAGIRNLSDTAIGLIEAELEAKAEPSAIENGAPVEADADGILNRRPVFGGRGSPARSTTPKEET